MRVADYVAERLYAEGVRNVYLVTGRGSIFLSDALARRGDMNAVSMHNEQSVGYAAVADAVARDGLGACMLSTGCGSTNAISGVLTAWQDEVPTIFISGQHLLHETTRFTGAEMRTFGEQEADIVALVHPITKFSCMLEDAAKIQDVMDQAIYAATSGRRGPVWIDIPLDLQSAQFTPTDAPKSPIQSTSSIPFADDLLREISSAERPVILIGSAANRATMRDDLVAFAEMIDAPVVYDASAVDVIPWNHRLHVGSVGAMGCSRAGSFAIQNADYVLVLGSALRSTVTGEDTSSFARTSRVVRVDIDRTQVRPDKPRIDRHVDMPVSQFVQGALSSGVTGDHDSWVRRCLHWKESLPGLLQRPEGAHEIDLYDLAAFLGEAMPTDAVLVTDSGLTELILPTNVHFREGQRCVHPFSQGAMGFALPAAVGAAFATNRPIVTAIGDGSVMMNLQELQVIRHHNLNVKVIITNNDAYAVIRKRQRDLFRGRTIGTDQTNGISCPDYSQIAIGFGLKYVRITELSELEQVLANELSTVDPAIIEVMTDTEQDYVRTSRATLQSRKSVVRPIEDQYPFLERDIVRREMVIEPFNLE